MLPRKRTAIRNQYRQAYGAGAGLGPEFDGWEGQGTWPPEDSVINLDHVQTVAQTRLKRRLGQALAETMQAVCRALVIATGCSAGG